MNKILLISKQLSDYLYCDAFRHDLNLINLGVPMFVRNHSKYGGGECIFRIAQEGVINLIPHMTKRIIKTTNVSIFKKLISQRYNGIQSTMQEEKELCNQVNELSAGCFVFALSLPNGSVEALTMHKFEYALSTMVSREAAFSI